MILYPAQRNLCRFLTAAVCYLAHSIHNVELLGGSVALPGVAPGGHPGVLGWGIFQRVLASEKASSEWAPRDHAQPFLTAGREYLVLDVAHDEGVLGLDAVEAGKPFTLAHAEGFLYLPAGKVGAADVADLARVHQIVERRDRLLDRGRAVPTVDLIQVYVVGVEPPEAGLAGRDDVL